MEPLFCDISVQLLVIVSSHMKDKRKLHEDQVSHVVQSLFVFPGVFSSVGGLQLYLSEFSWTSQIKILRLFNLSWGFFYQISLILTILESSHGRIGRFNGPESAQEPPVDYH